MLLTICVVFVPLQLLLRLLAATAAAVTAALSFIPAGGWKRSLGGVFARGWHLLVVTVFIGAALFILLVEVLLLSRHGRADHPTHVFGLLVYLLHVLARC